MSKKFTSFLVVLAALLLTVPTQAQFAKKAAKQTTVLKAGPLKVNDVQKVKAAMAKANDKTVGLAFTGAMHQQVAAEATLLKAAINNIESDKVAFEKQMEANLRASLYGNQCQIGKVFGNVMLNQTRQNVFELANNHQNVLHRAAGEVVDENGVITAIPEVKLRFISVLVLAGTEVEVLFTIQSRLVILKLPKPKMEQFILRISSLK